MTQTFTFRARRQLHPPGEGGREFTIEIAEEDVLAAAAHTALHLAARLIPLSLIVHNERPCHLLDALLINFKPRCLECLCDHDSVDGFSRWLTAPDR